MIRPKNKKIQSSTAVNIIEKKNSQLTSKPYPLTQNTQKIQQKLSFLKEQIASKKKMSNKDANLSQQHKVLHLFLKKINLNEYQQLLIENGIDSFDILKDAKQNELQQIGILKGHALKIMIHVKRYQSQGESKAEELNKTRQRQEQQFKKQSLATKETLPKRETQISNIQTQSFPIQSTRTLFCLYCFQRSQKSYCSSNCQSLYNNMFSKYESNLLKAQQSFLSKEKQKRYDDEKQKDQLLNNQQCLQNFDFVFVPNQDEEDFDEEQYQKIKELMKKQ